MKNFKTVLFSTIILACILCAGTKSFSQDKKGLARVTKIQGIEAYVMCEPLREYDVLFEVGTGLKASSIVTAGLVNEGVSDKINQFVKKALKEARDNRHDMDAVVYISGKNAVGIKFKKDATPEDKGIGRVGKVNGLETYVICEPLREYENQVEKTGGIKGKSLVTGGIVNNSIEEDIEQLVKRIDDEAADVRKKIDAVIYSSGKSGIGIKFKD